MATVVGKKSKIVTRGLKFCWDAGDSASYPGSGTTITDMVSGKQGTLNSMTYDSGNGGHLIANSSSDQIQFTESDFTTTFTDFTVETWVKSNQGNVGAYAIIFYWDPTSNNDHIQIRFADNGYGNHMQFTYKGAGGGINDAYNCGLKEADFTSGFRQIVWTRISGANRMYVDGEHKQVRAGADPTAGYNYTSYADSWSWSNTLQVPGNEFYMAGMDNGEWSNTKMYSVGLTAAEVLQNYNALKNRF